MRILKNSDFLGKSDFSVYDVGKVRGNNGGDETAFLHRYWIKGLIMNFILNKLLLFLVLSNVYLGTEFDLPRQDLLILDNGEEIKCQVESIDDAVIKVSTKDGERTVVREINVNAARDIVEAGVVKTKRYSGKLMYMDPDYLELKTSSGVMKFKKSLLRKIIISQEPSFNL